ncbi:MAG: L-ribulose-5-phosphate 3-epimerase [Sphaerochaetaceae bacterium]|nr:L-ribulose-5-phosphate 3-epimerase [Sphaerochaetaceae bacterium]
MDRLMSWNLLGVYEKSMPATLSFIEKLNAAKHAGFDFIEISIDETEVKLSRLDWTTRERKNLVDAMWEADIPILTMCLSGNRRYPVGSEDDEIRQMGIGILKKAVLLARDLGIRIIQVAGYDEYYGESNTRTRKQFLESIREVVRFAASHGVILAFETMESEFMNTVEKAMAVVSIVDSPFLQVYPDLGNITNAALLYERDAVSDLETGRGHIAAIHLKESSPGVYREVPFGEGHVDFPHAIQKAQELGIHLYVAEFWHVGSPTWEADLADVRSFFRSRGL